jgi:hypothetical protein
MPEGAFPSAPSRMIDLLFDILTVGGPIVLGVMGATMALWPPSVEGNTRFYWFAAFVLVGVISAIASLRELRSSHSLKGELAGMITGGDNFCFFKTQLAGAKDLTGPFQLWMFAPQGPVYDVNYWIAPAHPKDRDDYGSLDVRKPLHTIVHAGGIAWDRALPKGEYSIDFDAKNGHWNGYLRIFAEDGKLKQSIKVIGRDGRVLFEESEESAVPK